VFDYLPQASAIGMPVGFEEKIEMINIPCGELITSLKN
jgi:hypothetical protein